jgi:glycosyltransferase involved in cell wall biosynthesis
MIAGQIIVNATASDRSGALTILEQFIESIPSDKYEYIVFVNSTVKLNFSQPNIRIIFKRITSLRDRFLWDTYGIKNWLLENKVNPVATISLQNTNFRTKTSIPNFIYFHNAIPFSNAKWNPLNKHERGPWFYKNVYPLFVRLYINKKTEVFVQSNSVRDDFAKYFNFQKERVHVIVPKIKVQLLEGGNVNDLSLDQNQLNLFYPATPYIHKNHTTILRALSLLDKRLQNKISLYLTCKQTDLHYKINETELNFKIIFLGNIDFNRVVQLYNQVDALLFPSFIETIGLPLIEAASFGLKIIVSDLPYSREVLKNYIGATFVQYKDTQMWSNEITKLFTVKGQRYLPLKLEKSNSWQELFKILESKIQ